MGIGANHNNRSARKRHTGNIGVCVPDQQTHTVPDIRHTETKVHIIRHNSSTGFGQ